MRPTCLAFATSSAHEVALYAENDVLDTCEEYLYWAAKQHDTPGLGTTFGAIRDALAEQGQPLEECWPYDEHREEQLPTYQPPADAHTAEPRWTPGLVRVQATKEGVCGQLASDRAVILGLPTWPGFDRPMAGRLTVPDASDLDGGYHAVTLIAFDETTAEVLIRNSWGPRWGDEGTAWLPTAFLGTHQCEAWAINAESDGEDATLGRASSTRYGFVEG